MSRRLALLITADRYLDPRLSDLRSPVHDAEALADVLGDPEVGNFRVQILSNQPSHVASGEIEGLLAETSADDLVLLYFSCHGLKDDAGRLYFASPNTMPTRLASTSIPATFVTQQLDDTRSQKVVVLLDCCYSGAFIRGFSARSTSRVDIEDRLQGTGRAIITASTSMEYAFEATGGELEGSPVPSIFTSAVVKGIDQGLADRDNDGLISVDELYDFVLNEVRSQTPRQTPGKVSHTSGPLYIAQVRKTPRAARPRSSRLSDILSAADSESADDRAMSVPPLLRLAEVPDFEISRRARQWLDRLSKDDDPGVAFSSRQAIRALNDSFPKESNSRGSGGLFERHGSLKPKKTSFWQRPTPNRGTEATFHEPGGRESVPPPKDWPPEAARLSAGDFPLAGVGIRVPRNRHEIEKLLAHRPEGWEFLYFGAILHREMVKIDAKWREHDMRYAPQSARHLVPQGQEISYIQEAMHELAGRLGIEQLLSSETQQRAFGLPGEAGNQLLIEHLGMSLVQEFVELLDWSARVRGAIVDDAYRTLFGIAATFPDKALGQFRHFVDQSIRKFDRLSMLINAGINVYLPLDLTIEVDPRTVKLHERELKRLARRRR